MIRLLTLFILATYPFNANSTGLEESDRPYKRRCIEAQKKGGTFEQIIEDSKIDILNFLDLAARPPNFGQI